MRRIPTYGINVRVIVHADNPRQAAERFAEEISIPVEQYAEYCTINNLEPPEELRSLIQSSVKRA